MLERVEQVFDFVLHLDHKHANTLYANVLEYGTNSSYSTLTKFLSTKIKKKMLCSGSYWRNYMQARANDRNICSENEVRIVEA